MYLYGLIHFLPPFLAHAIGILVGGAYLVTRFAPQLKFVLALFVDGFFYWWYYDGDDAPISYVV